jgi:hypothetical protein
MTKKGETPSFRGITERISDSIVKAIKHINGKKELKMSKIGDVFFLEWKKKEGETVFFKGVVERIGDYDVKVIKYIKGDWNAIPTIRLLPKMEIDKKYDIKIKIINKEDYPEYFV